MIFWSIQGLPCLSIFERLYQLLILEVGRWINTAIEERLCLICNNGTVEDEEHFLLHYNFYYGERQDFYNFMKKNIPNFNNLSIEQKLQTVMTKEYVQIFR